MDNPSDKDWHVFMKIVQRDQFDDEKTSQLIYTMQHTMSNREYREGQEERRR